MQTSFSSNQKNLYIHISYIFLVLIETFLCYNNDLLNVLQIIIKMIIINDENKNNK